MATEAKVIAFANQKGGVGKTTAAINVACCLQVMGHKVLMVDADPQGSLRDWSTLAENSALPVVAMDRGNVQNEIPHFKHQFDYIVIDSAPRMSAEMARVIAVCDLCVVPITPSPLDMWASEEVFDALRQNQTLRGESIKGRILLNAVEKSSRLHIDIREAAEQWSDIAPVFKTMLGKRVVYRRTLNDGVAAISSTEGNAAEEIANLTLELKEIFDNVEDGN